MLDNMFQRDSQGTQQKPGLTFLIMWNKAKACRNFGDMRLSGCCEIMVIRHRDGKKTKRYSYKWHLYLYHDIYMVSTFYANMNIQKCSFLMFKWTSKMMNQMRKKTQAINRSLQCFRKHDLIHFYNRKILKTKYLRT